MARRKERKRNKLVLFAAEGHNATETLYLRDLISDTDGLTLRKAYGNETDPVGMVKNLIASKEAFGFDSDYGDLAFCFIDLDCNRNKEQQIRKAAELAADKDIYLIVSNPCFELWYICHFTSSPKNYTESKDLLKDMPKYIKTCLSQKGKRLSKGNGGNKQCAPSKPFSGPRTINIWHCKSALPYQLYTI